MKAQTIDITGKKAGTTELPSELFAAAVNKDVLAQYIRVYLHRNRQNTKKVQARGDVSGTTAKVWRQKGTGRARHGSRKAPIFVGGGQAHGPVGNENYKLSLPQKVRHLALISALTTKANDVVVLSDVNKASNKTKDLEMLLTKGLEWDGTKKVTLVLNSADNGTITASKNLANVHTTQATRINAFEVLRSDLIVVAQESLETLTKMFAQQDKKTKTETSQPVVAKRAVTTKEKTVKATKPVAKKKTTAKTTKSTPKKETVNKK